MRNFNLKLNFQLMLLTAGSLLIFGGWVYLNFNKSIEKQRSAIVEDFDGEANKLSDSISAQFYERYGDVQAFAKNNVLLDTTKQLLITETLNDYVKLYGIYDLIIYVDANGRCIATNTVSVSNEKTDISKLCANSFAEAPWFQATIKGQTTDDKSKGFSGTVVENLAFDGLIEMAFGRKGYTQGFSAAVRDRSGTIVGVISNRADSRYLESEIKNTYQNLVSRGAPSGEVTLVNYKGLILMNYDPKGDNSPEFNRDPKIWGSESLQGQEMIPVEALSNGKSSSGIFQDPIKNISQINGFTSLRGPKWIDSLNWGVIVRADTQDLFSEIDAARNSFLVESAIFFAVLTLFSFWFSMRLSKKIQSLTDSIGESVRVVGSTSESLASASQQLASSSQEQASSIEEISSSLEEITGMVSATLKGSQESLGLAQKVSELVNSGSSSMSELQNSVHQIAEANQRVEKLAKLIEEIGDKTELIDEIVFQTRLLSFNASVEAERAGEHGRGFAVVAQEVGNLAQMSGKSASEISQIVRTSIREAQEVVEINKTRVQQGVGLCGQTAGKLQQIETASREILSGSEQILRASEEQNTGIKQINESIQLISRATQENASSAESCSSNSSQLTGEGQKLTSVFQILKALVYGTNSGTSLDSPTQSNHRSNHRLNPNRTDSAPALGFKNKGRSQKKVLVESEGALAINLDDSHWENL